MDDIEQLKAELKETYLAYSMQRQISDFKGGFLARISHEIRTPLSSVISLHQIIINDLCDDPQEERECLIQALNSAQNLLKILDEMIVISKIDYGHIPISLEVFSLNNVLQYLLTLSNRLAENKKINLKITPSTEDVLVKGDEQKVLHILLTLVEILLGHISSGTLEIVLSVNNLDNLAIISFISPQIDSLFSEPKDLLKDVPTTSVPGSDFKISLGMKLILVQTMLERMKGSLDIIEQDGLKNLRCLLLLQQH